MSKYTLIGDMPKSCDVCNFERVFEIGNFDMKCLALRGKLLNSVSNQRHPQCPLQDTTELLEALTLDIMSLIYNNHDILLYSEKLKIEDKVRIKLNKAFGGNKQ